MEYRNENVDVTIVGSQFMWPGFLRISFGHLEELGEKERERQIELDIKSLQILRAIIHNEIIQMHPNLKEDNPTMFRKWVGHLTLYTNSYAHGVSMHIILPPITQALCVPSATCTECYSGLWQCSVQGQCVRRTHIQWYSMVSELVLQIMHMQLDGSRVLWLLTPASTRWFPCCPTAMMTLWGRCWHSWRPLCFLATGTCRRAWNTCSPHGRNTFSPPCRSCSHTQLSHIGRGGYTQWEVYPVCGSFSNLNICASSYFSVIRANILQFDVQLRFFAWPCRQTLLAQMEARLATEKMLVKTWLSMHYTVQRLEIWVALQAVCVLSCSLPPTHTRYRLIHLNHFEGVEGRRRKVLSLWSPWWVIALQWLSL